MNEVFFLPGQRSSTLLVLGIATCIFLSLLLLFKAMTPSGIFDTHDGTNHLARFANYRIALREGQIPPRWGPNLLNHYGYPVFLLNYPLLNILSLPISITGNSYETTFNIISFLLLVVGSIGVIFWLHNLFENHSLRTRVLALAFITCIYATTPFIWNVLFVRGSIGELAAYALFPWVLFVFQFQRGKSIRGFTILAAIVYAVFLLSHNISAVVGSILLFVWLFSAFKWDKVVLFRWFVTTCLAFGLVTWFWIPALTEASHTVVFQASNNSEAIKHLISVRQLLVSPLSFGFSYDGAIDSMSLAFSPILMVMILASALLLVYARSGHTRYFQQRIRSIVTSLSMACTLLLFQTDLSKGVWEIVAKMSILQFPWRLSLFATIFAFPATYWLWLHSSKYLKGVWIALLAVLLLYELSVVPVRMVSRSDAFYETFAETTSTQHENMPKSFRYLNIGDWKPSPIFLSGTGSITITRWNGTKRTYTLSTLEPVTIVEPTANFIGWKTYATDIKSNQSLELQYIDSEKIAGRIAYELQPGEYEIETKFSEFTYARTVGDIFSLITFTGCVFVGIYLLRKRQ